MPSWSDVVKPEDNPSWSDVVRPTSPKAGIFGFGTFGRARFGTLEGWSDVALPELPT